MVNAQFCFFQEQTTKNRGEPQKTVHLKLKLFFFVPPKKLYTNIS